jgi:hypothetical protein
MSEGGGGRVGCAKVAGYGCLGAVLLAVIAGVGIWASWDLLAKSGVGRGVRDTVATVKAEAAALQTLREQVLARYPAADLRPNVQIRSDNGVTTRTLELTLVDPAFELPATDEARLAQAREIAGAAAEAHPGIERYDLLRLVVVRQAAAGSASATTTWRYEFPTAELAAAGPP